MDMTNQESKGKTSIPYIAWEENPAIIELRNIHKKYPKVSLIRNADKTLKYALARVEKKGFRPKDILTWYSEGYFHEHQIQNMLKKYRIKFYELPSRERIYPSRLVLAAAQFETLLHQFSIAKRGLPKEMVDAVQDLQRLTSNPYYNTEIFNLLPFLAANYGDPRISKYDVLHMMQLQDIIDLRKIYGA